MGRQLCDNVFVHQAGVTVWFCKIWMCRENRKTNIFKKAIIISSLFIVLDIWDVFLKWMPPPTLVFLESSSVVSWSSLSLMESSAVPSRARTALAVLRLRSSTKRCSMKRIWHFISWLKSFLSRIILTAQFNQQIWTRKNIRNLENHISCQK